MSQEFINTTGSSDNIDPLSTAVANVANNLFSLPTSDSNVPTVVEVSNPEIQTTTTSNTNNLNIGNVYITNRFDSRANNPVLIRQKQRVTKPVELTPIETSTSTLALANVSVTYGSQEYINIGETPNDGNGDPLRVAFGKINNNFTNLFFTTTNTTTAYTSGITQNQVVLEVPITEFYQGEFQIRSSNPNNSDMQDITLTSSITNSKNNVRFSGHSTLFDGNAICRYDMDVFGSNVRIMINPLVNEDLEHFISSLVTYPISMNTPGIEIQLDGYTTGYLMGTENGLILTTES